VCCMEERVGKRMEVTQHAHWDLLCVIYDSIPFQDGIARIFKTLFLGVEHCNSTFISSVVVRVH